MITPSWVIIPKRPNRGVIYVSSVCSWENTTKECIPPRLGESQTEWGLRNSAGNVNWPHIIRNITLGGGS